jgi:hypothetical protein
VRRNEPPEPLVQGSLNFPGGGGGGNLFSWEMSQVAYVKISSMEVNFVSFLCSYFSDE